MKVSIIVLLVSSLALTLAYDDTDNKVDYEKLSPKEINQALDCYLDRGPCDNVQSHYKIHIRESMKNDCANCSDFHKHNGHMFFRTLEKINPKGLEEFKKKYAPEPGMFEEMEATLDHY